MWFANCSLESCWVIFDEPCLLVLGDQWLGRTLVEDSGSRGNRALTIIEVTAGFVQRGFESTIWNNLLITFLLSPYLSVPERDPPRAHHVVFPYLSSIPCSSYLRSSVSKRALVESRGSSWECWALLSHWDIQRAPASCTREVWSGVI